MPLTHDRGASAGFTLAEVLLATVVLGLALFALASFIVVGVRNGVAAREDSLMIRLAREKAEELHALTPARLDLLLPAECRDICASNCGCEVATCEPSTCCEHPCFPRGCAAEGRTARLHEDPVPDPSPGDADHEGELVRSWTVTRQNLGSPAGCVYRITVVVGSRSGLYAPRPELAVSWAQAPWDYVVGERNPRRAQSTVYRMR